MKGDINTELGLPYRRCKRCGRWFPAVTIVDLQAVIPIYEKHNRTYCKPCLRILGTESGIKS